MIYGVFDSRFGRCLVVFLEGKIVFLGFVETEEEVELEVCKVKDKFGVESLERDDVYVSGIGERVFVDGEFEVVLKGTDFQKLVWAELVKLRVGEVVSYSELAEKCGCPGAVRAVATAVGKNDVSVLVPCHRVVRKNGLMGQYRWGVVVKRKLLEAEGFGV